MFQPGDLVYNFEKKCCGFILELDNYRNYPPTVYVSCMCYDKTLIDRHGASWYTKCLQFVEVSRVDV